MSDEKLASLQTLIGTTEKQLKATKTAFRQTLGDKSISLDDRWELFANAPDYLKETYSSAVPPFLQLQKLIDLMQPDERGTQRNSTDMVWDMHSWIGHPGYEWMTEKLIDETREAVLRHNIGRWIYYW